MPHNQGKNYRCVAGGGWGLSRVIASLENFVRSTPSNSKPWNQTLESRFQPQLTPWENTETFKITESLSL